MRTGVPGYLEALVQRGKVPGVQYARANDAGGLWSFAAGWGNLRSRRPMTDTTALMAYSMSKLLTAEAVALLVRRKDLAMDDALSRYVPGTPYGEGITIRHLLEHRSGIPNPVPLRWIHPLSDHAAFDGKIALEDVLRQHRRLAFRPGTGKRYSNIGYWLLGQVIERVAGEPLPAFVEKHLLAPRKIATPAIEYGAVAGADEASGYLERGSWMNLARPFLAPAWIAGETEGRWLRIRPHRVNGAAFGGAIGNATAFCRFAIGLMKTTSVGLVEQEGGGAGFRCLLRIDTGRGRASVIMTNATAFDVKAALEVLDRLAIE